MKPLKHTAEEIQHWRDNNYVLGPMGRNAAHTWSDKDVDKELTEEEKHDQEQKQMFLEMKETSGEWGRVRLSKYPPEFNKSLQLSVCKIYAFYCVLCERKIRLHGYKMRENGKEYLMVHHIDGNPHNNDLINLVPLCQSCHPTTWGFDDLRAGEILEKEMVKKVHGQIYHLVE